jgi:ABC-type phosphate transport system substrate-binding protein
VRNLTKITTSLLMGLVLVAGLAGTASASAPTIDAGFGKITGSGATFPWNQYTKWFEYYRNYVNPSRFGTSSASKFVLDYTGGGSSTGISSFWGDQRMKDTQMFSGTDSVLSPQNRTDIASAVGTDYIVIPATAGPVAVAYRYDGLLQKVSATSTRTVAATLRLNGAVLCDIYSGTITRWNDPKIRALNPLITNLTSSTIILNGRSDGSGTTFIFASYLGKSATAAQKNCGYESNFTSNQSTAFSATAGTFKPVNTAPGTFFNAMRTAKGARAIIGGDGNAGVAANIAATNRSIGYVELSFAAATGLKTAAIETKSKFTSGANRGKFNYVLPSATSTTAALTAAVATEDPINPSTSYVQPVFAAGTSSYAIAGYSWLLVYKNWVTGTGLASKAQVQGLIAFLNWALTTGQSKLYVSDGIVGYAALPVAARNTAVAQLKTIKYDNVVLWP